MRVIIVLALLLVGPSFAQPFAPQAMRIAGTVERVDGDDITIRAIEGGGTNTVHLTKNAVVFGIARATLADIKPGAFVGVGARPEADGSQRAIRVTVFSEQQRGQGEGFRSWGRAPGGTMTNATVDDTVTGVDGQVVTVKYRGGEKRIVIPPDARILAYSAGERSEIKPGAEVVISRAVRKLDGTLEANRIAVGRGGLIPD